MMDKRRKRTASRLISVFLVAALALSFLPANEFAAYAEEGQFQALAGANVPGEEKPEESETPSGEEKPEEPGTLSGGEKPETSAGADQPEEPGTLSGGEKPEIPVGADQPEEPGTLPGEEKPEEPETLPGADQPADAEARAAESKEQGAGTETETSNPDLAKVEELIAVLPDEVTGDNRESVRAAW